MAEKKRILHKLRITEISAVDNPCQEHARMIIMKRAPIERVVTKEQRTRNIEARLAILKANITKVGNPNHDKLGRFANAIGLVNRLAGGAAPVHPRSSVNTFMGAQDRAYDRNRFVPPGSDNSSHNAAGVALGASLGLAAVATPILIGWAFSKGVSAVIRNVVTKPAERAILKRGIRRIMTSRSAEAMKTQVDDLTSRLSTTTGRSPIETISAVASALKTLREQEMNKTQTDPILDRLNLLMSLLQNVQKFAESPKVNKIADRIALLKMQVGAFTKFNPNHGERGRFASGSGGPKTKTKTETPAPKKRGKVARVAGKIARVVLGTAAVAAAAWFSSPHVFSILDKKAGGPPLSAKQMAGIIKYAESGALREKAESLVNTLASDHAVSAEAARQRVLKATQELIALRDRQLKGGKATHVPLSAVGRSSAFNIPPPAAKVAPKQDNILNQLQALLKVLQDMKT